MSQIVLASQSKQRQALLHALGLDFKSHPADLDELAIQDPDPLVRVKKLAKAKGEAVKSLYPEAILIAGDTFVLVDGRTLEKPGSLGEAKAMLRVQSGKWSQAVTGFYAYVPETHTQIVEAVTTDVKFRELSDDEIEKYCQNNPVFEWSAAFCPAYIEGLALVAEVRGSLTSLTHGLPAELVMKCLQNIV